MFAFNYSGPAFLDHFAQRQAVIMVLKHVRSVIGSDDNFIRIYNIQVGVLFDQGAL